MAFDHIDEKRKYLQGAREYASHLTRNAVKAKHAPPPPPHSEETETPADEAAETPLEQALEEASGGEAHADACPHCGASLAKKAAAPEKAAPAHGVDVLQRLRSSMG